jgi:hypothetical protein
VLFRIGVGLEMRCARAATRNAAIHAAAMLGGTSRSGNALSTACMPDETKRLARHGFVSWRYHKCIPCSHHTQAPELYEERYDEKVRVRTCRHACVYQQ